MQALWKSTKTVEVEQDKLLCGTRDMQSCVYIWSFPSYSGTRLSMWHGAWKVFFYDQSIPIDQQVPLTAIDCPSCSHGRRSDKKWLTKHEWQQILRQVFKSELFSSCTDYGDYQEALPKIKKQVTWIKYH